MNNGRTFAVLLFLAAAGSLAYQQGYLPFSVLDSNKIYLDPVFDSLTCARAETKSGGLDYTISREGLLQVEYKNFKDACSQNVDSAGCDYKITVDPRWYNSIFTLGYQYKVTDINNYCVKGTGTSCDWINENFQSGEYERTKNIKQGQTISLKIMNAASSNMQKTYTPYVLKYERGLGGSVTWNSQNCRVTKYGAEAEAVSINENQIVTGSTAGRYVSLYRDPVPFGESISFLRTFAMTPAEFTPTLNGKQVACVLGSIYSIGSITLKDGSTFKVSDQIVGSYGDNKDYQCCPGMKDNVRVCNNNWQWESLQTAKPSCYVDAQCQTFQYAGGWSMDYQDSYGKTLIRAKCTGGICDYRAETKKVGCTFSGQCATNQICDVGNTFTCIDSKGTTYYPPGSDRGTATPDYFWIIVLLAVGAAVLVTAAVIKKK